MWCIKLDSTCSDLKCAQEFALKSNVMHKIWINLKVFECFTKFFCKFNRSTLNASDFKLRKKLKWLIGNCAIDCESCAETLIWIINCFTEHYYKKISSWTNFFYITKMIQRRFHSIPRNFQEHFSCFFLRSHSEKTCWVFSPKFR